MFDFRRILAAGRLVLASGIVLSACSAPEQTDLDTPEYRARTFTPATIDGVLEFVNVASLTELDDDVRLDARAARNIVAHRVGTDGLDGTIDDDLFGSIGELDAISYVGNSALDKLAAYAEANGWVAAGGAPVADLAQMLAVVNAASLDELDDDVPLDARAARNIIAHRDGPDGTPGTADDDAIDTLEELDAISYVGTTAIDRLYAYATSLSPTPTTPQGCLIISEYIEGTGQFNKAIELFNCGTTPVRLSDFDLCMVRNGDSDCTGRATLADVILPAGEVYGVCRNAGGDFLDPMYWIRENCDEVITSVTTFNGDDRIAILDSNDDIVDAIGFLDEWPWAYPWQDVVLRRCNFRPWTGEGEWYSATQFFTEHSRGAGNDFGIPPVETCPR